MKEAATYFESVKHIDPYLGLIKRTRTERCIPIEEQLRLRKEWKARYKTAVLKSLQDQKTPVFMVFGGLDPSANGNYALGANVLVYDVIKRSWSSYGVMLEPRNYHAAAYWKAGNVYITGGNNPFLKICESLQATNTTFQFNIYTKKWRKMANMKHHRALHSMIAIPEGLFVFGGRDNKGSILPVVEKYNPEQDEWHVVKAMPEPRMGMGCAFCDGLVWIIGGITVSTTTQETQFLILDTVICYDPVKDLWIGKCNLNEPRAFAGAANVLNDVCVIGGLTMGENGITSVPWIDVYRAEDQKWERRASLPTPKHAIAIARANNFEIYVFGGMASDGKQALSETDMYDATKNDKLTDLAFMPVSVAGAAAIGISADDLSTRKEQESSPAEDKSSRLSFEKMQEEESVPNLSDSLSRYRSFVEKTAEFAGPIGVDVHPSGRYGRFLTILWAYIEQEKRMGFQLGGGGQRPAKDASKTLHEDERVLEVPEKSEDNPSTDKGQPPFNMTRTADDNVAAKSQSSSQKKQHEEGFNMGWTADDNPTAKSQSSSQKKQHEEASSKSAYVQSRYEYSFSSKQTTSKLTRTQAHYEYSYQKQTKIKRTKRTVGYDQKLTAGEQYESEGVAEEGRSDVKLAAESVDEEASRRTQHEVEKEEGDAVASYAEGSKEVTMKDVEASSASSHVDTKTKAESKKMAETLYVGDYVESHRVSDRTAKAKDTFETGFEADEKEDDTQILLEEKPSRPQRQSKMTKESSRKDRKKSHSRTSQFDKRFWTKWDKVTIPSWPAPRVTSSSALFDPYENDLLGEGVAVHYIPFHPESDPHVGMIRFLDSLFLRQKHAIGLRYLTDAPLLTQTLKKLKHIKKLRHPTVPMIIALGGLEPKRPLSRHFGKAVLRYYAPKNRWEFYGWLPESRNNHGAAYLNDVIYMIGGYNPLHTARGEMVATNTVFALDIRSGTWERRAKMLYARAHQGVAVMNEKIYCIGGRDHRGRILKSVEVYDPRTDSWQEYPASLEEGRMAMATITFDGRIWIMGGVKPKPEDPERHIVLATVQCLDTSSQQWTVQRDLRVARAYASAVTLENKIWLCGGCCARSFLESMTAIDVYDPEIAEWRKVADLVNARHCLTAAPFAESCIFMFGGICSQEWAPLSRNEVFLTEIGVYLTASLPFTLTGVATVVVPSEMPPDDETNESLKQYVKDAVGDPVLMRPPCKRMTQVS